MKKFFLIGLLFLLCACSNDNVTLETIIENKKSMAIAINYPLTKIKKLDDEILKYIEEVNSAFKNEYENYDLNSSELNIDYKYFKTDNYINVELYTFINSSILAHPINEIKTIVYDTKKNKIIKLSDFIDLEKLKELVPVIKQKIISKYKDCVVMESLTTEIIPDFSKYENFTISDTLNIYFEPYVITSGFCNIIEINIEIPELKKDKNVEEKTIKHTSITKTINPNQKVVAITFDDGPSKYTSSILDILKKNDACATFFVLGNKVAIYKDTLNKAINYGNEIGNHSYNHKWLTRLSLEEFKNQIDKTQDIIYENTNYIPTLFRPTYGSVNNKIKNNTDLDIVLWDVDSLDWKLKNSKKIINRIIDDISDMDIVLFHDTYKSTEQTIEKIIPMLKEKGFQFVTVSELYEIKKIRNQLDFYK